GNPAFVVGVRFAVATTRCRPQGAVEPQPTAAMSQAATVGEFHPFGPLHTAAFYAQLRTLSLLLEHVANNLTGGGCAGCGLANCGPDDGKNRVNWRGGTFRLHICTSRLREYRPTHLKTLLSLVVCCRAPVHWDYDDCLWPYGNNRIVRKWCQYIDQAGMHRRNNRMTIAKRYGDFGLTPPGKNKRKLHVLLVKFIVDQGWQIYHPTPHSGLARPTIYACAPTSTTIVKPSLTWTQQPQVHHAQPGLQKHG
ncbi:hypothetical protein FN846DRAFT_1007615, partial [Sphaerosporella brunnea]